MCVDTTEGSRVNPPIGYTYMILSIRGGGIKGLIPACILADFEERNGVRCRDAFDLIVGTSTGGILALGLSRGIKATSIRDMYLEQGPSIFKRRFWSRCGLFGAKYDLNNLRRALDGVFGRDSLGECAKVMVCATAVDTGRSAFIKSWKTPHISIVEAACATSAAPTYFDPVRIDGFGLLADGGIYANNPASFALTQARKLFCTDTHRRLSLVDLACGETAFEGRTGDRWGLVQYAGNMVDMFINSGVDAAAHQCAVDLGDDYLELVPGIGSASKHMDDASALNMLALIHAGEAASVNLGPKLDDFVGKRA